METSLRLRGGCGGGGGGSSDGGLRIHAKERLPLGSNALLQAHAEVDTTTGAPSYLAVLVRHFSPLFSANVGVGIHLHSPSATAGGHDFTYSIRAKKAIPFTSKGFLGIIFKTRLLADKQFNPTKRTGSFEFACDIFDFRKDQDVRLKLGYELYHKMPYFQLRESNWTLNAYMDGKWDIRFDM